MRSGSTRRGVEDEEADLVLGNIDRPLETDGDALPRHSWPQPASRRSRASRLPPCPTGEIRLNEISSAWARRYRRSWRRKVRTVSTLPAALRFRKDAGRAGPRPHSRLHVDTRQVTRHRPLTEEQGRGDLAVRAAFSNESRDPSFSPPSGLPRASAHRSCRLGPCRSAHTAAPSSSNPASAASSASRAARFCRPRLVRRRAREGRALAERIADRYVLAHRSSKTTIATSTVPSAGGEQPPATRRRSASTRHGGPDTVGLPGLPGRAGSSIRPSSSSASA